MREQNWNKNWLFWEEKDAFALIWSIPEHAQKLPLPHDAMIYTSAHPDSPAGGDGGFWDGGRYIYEKKLLVPTDWRDMTR